MSTPTEDQPTVLVVDDEDAVRRLFVRALERRGHRVLAVATAGDARRLLRADGAEVDVVLLDVDLPGHSGIDLLEELRATEATATLPVILVTGQGGATDRVRGLSAGADDFVAKPVDLDELAARVAAQLRGRDAWLRRISQGFRDRAEVAARLLRIDSGRDLVAVATDICTELLTLPHASRAALLSIGRGDVIHVVGMAPCPREDPRRAPVPPPAGARLLERLGDGAWIDPPSIGSTRPFATGGEPPGPLVIVELSSDGTTTGFLALETDSTRATRSSPRAEALLSAAIDLSPVVERLVGQALGAGDDLDAARAELRQVIDDREFHPVYQPIAELGTGCIVGFEALTRFADGARPDLRFVETIRLGLGHELERATLAAAIAGAAELPPGPYLCVNVSASLLTTTDLADLRRPDRNLVVEVTEHERVDDYDELRRCLEGLGDDVRLSVDDTGSGYASLRHVLSLGPDFVKLDRGWVSGIQDDPARQTLVLGLVRFVAELGADVVAEGIETDEELATVVRLGVGLGQGFLIGRPAPADRHQPERC